jgi:hypothetical protein
VTSRAASKSRFVFWGSGGCLYLFAFGLFDAVVHESLRLAATLGVHILVGAFLGFMTLRAGHRVPPLGLGQGFEELVLLGDFAFRTREQVLVVVLHA